MNDTDTMKNWCERKDSEKRAETWFWTAMTGWSIAIVAVVWVVVLLLNWPN